jgi:hypothetical protein
VALAAFLFMAHPKPTLPPLVKANLNHWVANKDFIFVVGLS